MTTLIIRGVKSEINLSGNAKAPYNIKKYEMGVPDPESDGDCADTITLVVAARTKAVLSAYVGRLYRALREAVDFAHGKESTPVYLEATVPEQDGAVYATITDYKFHALGDPYDHTSGGLVIQDATLVIQRRPWSSLPPQADPFVVKIGQQDVSARSSAVLRVGPGVEIAFDNEDQHYGFRYLSVADAPNEAAFLRNAYAYGGITNFRNASNDNVEKQVRNWPLDHNYEFGASESSMFRFYLGSTGPMASQISAAVFKIAALGAMTGTGLTIECQSAQNDWQAINKRVDYANGFSLNTGDALLRWDGDALLGKTTVLGILGYWYRVTGTSSTGVVTGYPVQTERSVFAPYTPYVDVDAAGGDMPADLRLMLKFHNFNPGGYETTDDYWADDHALSTIVVASARLSDGSGLPATRAFINMTDLGPEEITPANATIEGRLRAPGGKALIVSAEDIIDFSETGEMIPLARIAITPVWPGPYRLYLRYRPEAVPENGGQMFLRASVTPLPAGAASPRSVTSLTHKVDLSRSDLRDRVNVADLGVFTLGSKRISFGDHMDYEIAIELEGNATSGSIGQIAIQDLVMLPIDETFSVFDGTRTPPARNATGTTSHGKTQQQAFDLYGGMNMHERNSETVIIDGLLAGKPATYTARAAFTGGVSPSFTSWSAAVSDPWPRRTGASIVADTDFRRRIYFLFYKRLPTGDLVSSADFYYSVQAFRDKKFIALPASL